MIHDEQIDMVLKKILLSFLVIFVGVGALAGYLGREPDVDLEFRRLVTSEIQPASLYGFLRDVRSWPAWFFQVQKVRILSSGAMDSSGAAASEVQVGTVVELEVEPAQRKWRHFMVTVKVLELAQDRIKMEVIKDSTGRTQKVVTGLQWEVTVAPHPKGGSIINGRVWAHTTGFRGRMLGRLSPRILLNQLFYCDLEQLGRGAILPDHQFSLEPVPGAQ